MKTPWPILLLLGLLLPAQAAAEHLVIGPGPQADRIDSGAEHSITLALSGGGARGLSAIGILKAFEEKGLRVRAISGTSIGGIVGGLYACGYSPDSLIAIIDRIAFSDLFSNRPARSSMFLFPVAR